MQALAVSTGSSTNGNRYFQQALVAAEATETGAETETEPETEAGVGMSRASSRTASSYAAPAPTLAQSLDLDRGKRERGGGWGGDRQKGRRRGERVSASTRSRARACYPTCQPYKTARNHKQLHSSAISQIRRPCSEQSNAPQGSLRLFGHGAPLLLQPSTVQVRAIGPIV